MISHYILRTVILLGMIFHLPSALGGPLLLAPEPVLHDMMQDSFFAWDLIKKRLALRAGSGYPTVMLGGTVETGLMNKHSHKESLKYWDPEINTILVNTVICFDTYVMLALSVRHEKNYSSLDRFAIIWGDYSKANVDTYLGQFRLPFKLNGAIGRFISPAIPFRSQMMGIKNEIGLCAVQPEKQEKQRKPKEVSGLLIGVQKDLGMHTLSLQMVPFLWDRLIINPQWKLSQFDYAITIGAGYDSKSKYGSVYSSIIKSICELRGHWLWKRASGKANVEFNAGHLEFGVHFPLPVLKTRGRFMVGYGWPERFIPKNTGENAVFGTLKLAITQYAQLRIGIQFKNLEKTVKKRDRHGKSRTEKSEKLFVPNFILHLDFNF